MTGITRATAAKLIAGYLGSRAVHVGGRYDTYTIWYKNNVANRTIVLAGYESGSYTNTYCAMAVVKGYGASNPPALVVRYRSAIGIENYYTYQSHNIGAAATAYIGDYSGQLIVVKNVASFSSTILPFSLNLVYNSCYNGARFEETKSTGMTFGYGWKLDAVQKLMECEGALEDYLLYIDGDGTYHYFYSNGDGTWKDEDGLKLTCKKATLSGISTGVYEIASDQGDKLVFYKGFLVQQVDNNGNIIRYMYNNVTSTSGTSWLPKGNGTDKITSVIQTNKGAGNLVLATLTYDGSALKTIKDYAGNTYTLSYEGNNLKSISTTAESGSTALTYSSGYLTTIKDTVSNYQVNYSFFGGRISSYSEKNGSVNGLSISVSGSRDKTVYRLPAKDGVQGSTDDILNTLLFDDEGRTINSYSTNVDSSKIYGASTGVYSASSGNAPTNNHLITSATIGIPSVNLLSNNGFEDNTRWTYTSFSRVSTKPRTGAYSIKSALTSSAATASAYAHSASLTKNKTYTVSAYVNTSGATFAAGTGIRLEVQNYGGTQTYFTSDPLTYKTSNSIDEGWTRMSMTFTTPATGAHRIVIVNEGVTGNVYIDDLQVEEGEAAGNLNLLTNGTMESTSGWTLKTNAQYSDADSGKVLSGEGSVSIASTPLVNGYLHQTVPINLPYTQTYVLSGWAYADALPANQPLYPANKRFCLKAEVYYSETNYDEFFLPFSPEIDNEWQFVSMVICPKQKLTVQKIIVYCAYHFNVDTAYFDNISLTREPAQTMKYDDNGYLVSVATDGISEDVSTYSGGNLIKTVTSGSGTFTYEYDTKHNLTEATNGVITQTNTYDTNGNVLTTELSGADTEETISTSATYGGSNNRLVTTTDQLGGVTNYYYKNSKFQMYAQPSVVKDPLGYQTVYDYNMDGTPKTQSFQGTGTTEAEKITLTYTYEDGLLSEVTRTNNAKNQVYGLSYNDFGQMTQVKVGDRILTTNTYNNAGALTRQKWGDNQYTAFVDYTYDELGRVKTTTTETGKKVEYAYNSDGQLASKTMNPSTTKLRYDYLYDSLGRLIRSSRHDNGTLKLETRHEYDTSNRLSKQYINLVDRVESVAYTYNNKGLLTKLDNNNASDLTYAYDKLQRLSTRTNPAMVQTYSYEQGTNLVSNISYDPGTSGTLFNALDLGYDYDYRGYVTSITSSNSVIQENATYTYDNQGQLTNATIGSTDYEYTYDTAGNILTVKKNNIVTGSYDYAASGWIDLLMSYNEVDFEYDAIGNPTKYYNGTDWDFTWQNGRELTTATKTGTSISYTYDGDGIRTSKTVGDVTYNYVYASGKLMRQTWTENGTTQVMDFIYDDKGAPYALRYNNKYYYYVLNLQGDVIKIVTAAGDSYGVYRYDAWGNITYATTNNSVMKNNPLRYRGYYYDTETGFYYLQSRYYDPAIGRFINADAFASTGQDFIGYNMFAYCGNNPVNRSDFTGAAWEHWAFAAGIVAIAAAAVVIASGGVAAAAFAVASIANGVAVSSTVATVAAGAFVGSAYGLAASAYGAWIESDSAAEFADYGKNGLLSTAAGGAFGGVSAYGLSGHTCFAAGTMVKAENGNIPIEQVAAGMLVWAWNEETGDVGLKRVVETYESETRDLVHVFVNGEEIITTPTHPFYSPVKGWMQAVHLRAGDILVLVNGEYVVVEKVQYEILQSPVKVYNFQVEDYHTYYVAEHGVLVHNRCILDKNGVRVEVRTSNEHGLPHAHISDGKVNTTIGLDQAPMRGHPSLTSKMWQVVEKNWEAIADGINQYFPKTH